MPDLAPYAGAIQAVVYVAGAGLAVWGLYRLVKLGSQRERARHLEAHEDGRERVEDEEEAWDDTGGTRGASERGLRDRGDT